ncbi:hypothetical protein BHE74_00005111 [Ensete ventricosum]|uniref:Uncharacterized protein n=1 Tax=Ensete ventricosum TaxID=4639 RepID=A0A444E2F1_ENSVE|nr:hypothetical protein GW17_00032213 [Ensete ventricosum]RWW86127.1 hypothetical protein BHE74_00005111 [Ensete ventricosum]RZR72019.1 hypothetical protein BHM03_00009751 [Ensete ventricosum]
MGRIDIGGGKGRGKVPGGGGENRGTAKPQSGRVTVSRMCSDTWPASERRGMRVLRVRSTKLRGLRPFPLGSDSAFPSDLGR